MSTGLIEIMKRAATDANEAGQPCDLRYGTVVSVSPLRIQVSHQFTIPESLLIVPKSLTDFEVKVTFNWESEDTQGHTHDLISDDGEKKMKIHNALEIGDYVALIRQKGGQKYLIVDRVVVK